MFFCYVREVEGIAFESFFLSKLTEGEIKLSEAGGRGGAVLLSIRSHALQSGIHFFPLIIACCQLELVLTSTLTINSTVCVGTFWYEAKAN